MSRRVESPAPISIQPNVAKSLRVLESLRATDLDSFPKEDRFLADERKGLVFFPDFDEEQEEHKSVESDQPAEEKKGGWCVLL